MRAANFFLFRLVLLAVVLLCTMLNNGSAQEFRFSGKRKKQGLSFLLIRNLVIIPVYVNGKGPYNFILDTGVGPMIVTDSVIAQDLSRKKLRPIKISGLGDGPEINALLSNEVSASVGKAEISYLPTAILKEDLLSLSNFVGVKISGLLGYYFFRSFIVRINYSTKRLLFSTAETRAKIKGERIPLTLINYKPYVNIDVLSPELGKLKLKVLIDNGASHALSLETLKENPFPVPANSIKANLGIGLGGPISGSLGRTSFLQIGNFSFKNVLSSYPRYNAVAIKTYLSNRNGNLGAEILTRFSVTFDYADSAVYLKANNMFKRPFEHDMSGIELYVEDVKNRFFVNRVEQGSPADEAGIKAGDEILTVNFSKAGSLTLDELSRLLKSGDGRPVYLSLNRAGELIVKMIKLKKRI